MQVVRYHGHAPMMLMRGILNPQEKQIQNAAPLKRSPFPRSNHSVLDRHPRAPRPPLSPRGAPPRYCSLDSAFRTACDPARLAGAPAVHPFASPAHHPLLPSPYRVAFVPPCQPRPAEEDEDDGTCETMWRGAVMWVYYYSQEKVPAWGGC